jgi:hypothetical protein
MDNLLLFHECGLEGMAWLSEERLRFGSSLDGAGFGPAWSVWQSQSGDPGKEISTA